VSCTSTTACTATGSYSPGGAAAYFIETWHGAARRMTPAPLPSGFVSGSLLAICCSPGRCTTVGAWAGGARRQATSGMAG
jgi:hypothetical protein